MPRSWQEDFFEKLVETAKATGDSRLATGRVHPRKKTVSFEHPQLHWVECVFDANRVSGNQDSQVLVVEAQARRGTELDSMALRREFQEAGINGDLQMDGGVVFAQSRWGWTREAAFPVHDPLQVRTYAGFAVAFLKVLFDHLERRRKLLVRCASIGADGEPTADYALALEQYLEDLLVDQWETLLWSANLEYLGRQVICGDLGWIDLLARDRTTRDFVVIELKKDQTDDEVVGQLARYMGWVKQQRSDPAGVKVRGIIVAHEASAKLRSAVLVLNGVEIFEYRVKVELRAVQGVPSCR